MKYDIKQREPLLPFGHLPLKEETADILLTLLYAGVAELADALDLGSSAARRGGSTPLVRTRNFIPVDCGGDFYFALRQFASLQTYLRYANIS